MAMAKIIAKKNTGPQPSRKPCGVNPSSDAPCPSWKISFATPNAAAVESRLTAVPRIAISGAWSATSSRMKPSAKMMPITSGR